MNELTKKILDGLTEIVNKSLTDQELPLVLFDSSLIQQTYSIPFLEDMGSLKFAPELNFAGRLINSQDDLDKTKLETSLETLSVPYIENRAYLNFSADAKMALNAGLDADYIGLEMGGDQRLKFNLYMSQAEGATIKDAVLRGLPSYIMKAFSTEQDIWSDLNANDVFTMQLKGGLKTTVKVKWSDALTAGMSKLAKVFSVLGVSTEGKTLDLTVGTKAEASLKVSIKDEFVLALRKINDNDFKVSLSKAVDKNLSAGMGLSVGVEFADSEDMEEVLNDLYQSLLDMGREEAMKLVKKAKAGLGLEDSEQGALTRVQGVLGNIPTGELEDKLVELDTKVKSTLKSLAEMSAKAELTVAYLRSRSESSLFQANMNLAALKEFQRHLILFNMDALFEAVRNGDERITGAKGFHEVVIKRNLSLGMSLKLGGLETSIGQEQQVSASMRENIEKQKQYSFSGYEKRNKAFKFNGRGNSFDSGVEFSAVRSEYTGTESIKAKDLEYSLRLFAEETEKSTSNEELRDFVDQAVVWWAVSQEDTEKVYQELKPLLNQPQVSYSYEVAVPDETLRTLVKVLAVDGMEMMAEALAAALPYKWPDIFGRRTVAERIEVYKEMFMNEVLPKAPVYFGDHTKAVEIAKGTTDYIYDNMDREKYSDLLFKEDENDYQVELGNLGNVLLSQDNFIKQRKNLFKGFKVFRAVLADNTDLGVKEEQMISPELKDILDGLRAFWGHDYRDRALGYYILKLADQYELEFTSRFSVKYKDEKGLEKVRVFQLS